MLAFGQSFDKSDSLAKNIPDSITKTPDIFAKYLKGTFGTDDRIIRALYIWLATNIIYDLDKLDSISSKGKKYHNEDLIESTLKNKKGICENYAAVFSKICTLCGIQSYIVTGYIRQFGYIETKIGHEWNVAEIDHTWYLFDPTWGAGFVRYERFHKKFSFEYFKANPDSFVKTHMPFDPIWQLKEFPITHRDFILETSGSSAHMNFSDSINLYSQLSEHQKIKSAFDRSVVNGLNQPELELFYNRNKKYSIYALNNYYVLNYQNAVDELNKAIEAYNKFIANKKKDIKISNQNSKLDKINGMLNKSKEYMNNIVAGVVPQSELVRLKTEILKFEKKVKIQKTNPNHVK